jgi:hypothetical protein
MIGDRERIAIRTVAEQELCFVIGAPEFVGPFSMRERSALGPATRSSATLDQAMAIEHGMEGAFGGNRNIGESAQPAFADLTGAPAGVLVLHVEDVVLDLKGELVGVAIGAPAAVDEPVPAALLVAIEELVTGLARDAELAAKFRHRLAGPLHAPKLGALGVGK